MKHSYLLNTNTLRSLIITIVILGFSAIIFSSNKSHDRLSNPNFDEDPHEATGGDKRLPIPIIKNSKTALKMAGKKLNKQKPLMCKIDFLVKKSYFNPKIRKTIYWLSSLDNFSEVVSGNDFMIRLKSRTRLYACVLYIDSLNNVYVLYSKQPLEPDQERCLPFSKTRFYRFDNNPGLESFYVYLSTSPLKELNQLVNTIPAQGKNLNNRSAFIQKLKQLRPQEMDQGICLAKIDRAESIARIQDNDLKVKPHIIFFQKSCVRQIILIHNSPKTKVTDKTLITKAKKESWGYINLFLKNAKKTED